MTALIDTCIIVDTLQNREPFCRSSKELFLLAANERFKGYISAKSVTDIYYLTHHLTHSDKETRNILAKLFLLFDVADTSGTDCLLALPSSVSDYEDAVLVETAKRISADCIVTRNENDFTNSTVPVYSPSVFIKMLE